MTKRLYHQDSFLWEFTATVLTCEPCGEAFAVTLDQTAFYPEGGGQAADRGVLGGAAVLDVQEKAGEVIHTVSAPLPVGAAVTGTVDVARRFDQMQQHSGEHILSGIICAMKDCANVGFHIGEEDVRLDFSAPLTPEEIALAERRANEAIWQDLPVETWFPDAEALAALDYRSKKALTGDVRIVRIAGFDTCACCGTHVATTGQIGQIKIVEFLHYKGGMRLFIRCGGRALRHANETLAQSRAVSRSLSAKPAEISAAVEKLLAERDRLRARAEALSLQAFRAAAAALEGEDVRILVTELLEAGQLRKAAGQLAEGAKTALILLPREDGWSYALSAEALDVRPIAKALNAAFAGKGGGGRDMVQGVLGAGSAEEIRACVLQETENLA